jgi:predicted RNA polymerase sigma factor
MLYALLEGFRPTPAVRVNRAFAVGQAKERRWDSRYPYVHLVRGTLLAEAGQTEAAATALRLAAQHARNAHEQRQLEERLARCGVVES